MRNLLEQTEHQLGVLFEHGLGSSSRFYLALGELGERFTAAGLAGGAQHLATLGAELGRSRLDAHWQSGKATEAYAALWEYIMLCKKRLEYIQAKKTIQD